MQHQSPQTHQLGDRLQPTQIQFCIQNQGQPNQQFIAVSTAGGPVRSSSSQMPPEQAGQTLLAVSSQQMKQPVQAGQVITGGHQRVLSVPMGPNGQQMSPNPNNQSSTQPMFVQQVRPVPNGFHSNQIQMISQNGQLIPQSNNQLGLGPGQQPPIQNQPQLIDQNGQMIHTVVSPQGGPPSNDLAFKQMIINQSSHIIGQPQSNMVNQHGQMVNPQMIQQNSQSQPQGQIIQNIPAPGQNMGGNIVSIPNGVNVQMANPTSQVISQDGHPMIHQGQLAPPGVKLQPGQVIMNGGQFRPNQLQMAPVSHIVKMILLMCVIMFGDL